jgi:hypothetical protein
MAQTVVKFPEHAPGATSLRVLSSAPLLELAELLAKEAEALMRRAPQSEIASTISSIKEDLLRAINHASKQSLWLTVEQLHELTKKPGSTLRRECGQHGKLIGASKQHGQWYIYWPHYESYMNEPSSVGEAA